MDHSNSKIVFDEKLNIEVLTPVSYTHLLLDILLEANTDD